MPQLLQVRQQYLIKSVGLESGIGQVGLILVINLRIARNRQGRVARAEQSPIGKKAVLASPDEAAKDKAFTTLVKVAKRFGSDQPPLVAYKAEEEKQGGENEEKKNFEFHSAASSRNQDKEGGLSL